MQTGSSIWDLAWSAAQDILHSLIGDVLGWLIILAVLSPFVLILYFVLKKTGWRGLYPDPYRKRVIVRTTFGSPQKVEKKLLGQLGNPGAHAEMMKLDLSDPQARAKVEQFLQGIGARDPAAKAQLEEALRNAEASGAKANFTLYTSNAAPGVEIPATPRPAPDPGAAPPPAPGSTVLDGAPVSAPPPASGPTLLGGAPDWRQELQEKWQRERDDLAHEEHVAFSRSLERNRASLQAFIRPVRYAITGLCVLAALACFLKASHAHTEFNILALVLAGCAVWACFGFNPDDVA